MGRLNQLIQQQVYPPDLRRRQMGQGHTSFQLCTPLLHWDWTVSSTGIISNNMFTFCDSVPDNPEADTFLPGGSFSDSYRGFLSWLNESFRPQATLLQLLTFDTLPPGSPDEIVAPSGWVKVKDGSNILRWQLAYSASDNPDNWLLNNGGQSVPLVVPLDGIPLKLLMPGESPDKGVPLASGRLQQLHLTARAWGIVRITPGAWYNSSIIDQARLQTNAFFDDKHFDDLVGPGKILSCSVSEALVVLEPTLVFNSVDEQTNRLLSETPAANIQAESLTLDVAQVNKTQNADGSTSWKLGSNPDQAYILGVYLKKYYNPVLLTAGRSMPAVARSPVKQPARHPIHIAINGRLQVEGAGRHAFWVVPSD